VCYTDTMNEDLKYKKPIFIFDFDDTLIKSESKVVIKKKDGRIIHLDAKEYEKYKPEIDDVPDFTSFNNIKEYKTIEKTTKRLKWASNVYGQESTYILSARQYPNKIHDFTKENKIETNIHALAIPFGNNNGIHKYAFVKNLIILNKMTNDYVEYYDDRDDCIKELSNLKEEYPSIHFKIYKVIDGKITEYNQ